MRFSQPLAVALSQALIATGCSFIIPSTQTTTPERYCAPVRPMNVEIAHAPASVDPTAIPLSERSLQLAAVMNVLPLLSKMAVLDHAGESHGLAFLELRQMLTDRLLLTLFEVSSTTAEIVCERDRADQVADRMDEIDSARVKKLTLVSIVVAGVASIVSGAIGLAGAATTASDASTVASGVLASLFGGMALFTATKQEFSHERNLLKEVWDNPTRSTIFSPAVWRFLQRPHHADRSATARDEVINAWRQQGRLGEPGSPGEDDRMALIFGAGGTYASADLRARASMLETLEAHVQLFSEELEQFLGEFIHVRHEAMKGAGQ